MKSGKIGQLHDRCSDYVDKLSLTSTSVVCKQQKDKAMIRVIFFFCSIVESNIWWRMTPFIFVLFLFGRRGYHKSNMQIHLRGRALAFISWTLRT